MRGGAQVCVGRASSHAVFTGVVSVSCLLLPSPPPTSTPGSVRWLCRPAPPPPEPQPPALECAPRRAAWAGGAAMNWFLISEVVVLAGRAGPGWSGAQPRFDRWRCCPTRLPSPPLPWLQS